MPETAEAVSATLTTDRNCTVEITNLSSFCLIDPKVFMSSGLWFHPPQPTIRSPMTEVCSFSKDELKLEGAVGVLTYDLFDMKTPKAAERLAIMFSVPIDKILFKNLLGVGVFEAERTCDNSLYKHMSEGKDTHFTRIEGGTSGLVHGGTGLILHCKK